MCLSIAPISEKRFDMATATQLIHEGFIHVATFNQQERAENRAALHQAQGHEARVVTNTGRSGLKTFSVYIKIKEV